MKILIPAFAALAAFAAPASAAPPSGSNLGTEASIPFASTQIHDFQADGTAGIYIQDRLGKWYRGTFIGSCTEMPWATAVGVDTGGTPNLDKFGTILVRHQRCALSSLVRVAAPPTKAKHHKA